MFSSSPSIPKVGRSPVRSELPVILSGNSVYEFLQRQITNDISGLPVRRALTTSLTNASARLLDVLDILFLEEHRLAIFPSLMTAENLYKFFKSKIFLMDKVTAEIATGRCKLVTFLGEGAVEEVQNIGMPVPLEHSATITATQSGELMVWRSNPSKIPIISVAGLGDFGPDFEVHLEDERYLQAHYQQLRIGLGLAEAPNEINSDYTPLETNLAWTVSETKGCYTGQEVLARQITYDKVTKSLVRLVSDSPISTGHSVYADGKLVGTVTSTTETLDGEVWSLAVLRRPYTTPGTRVSFDSNPNSRTGEVLDFIGANGAIP